MIEIKHMQIQQIVSPTNKKEISKQFDLKLDINVPDLVPFYKRIYNKVDESIKIHCHISPLIIKIGQKELRFLFEVLNTQILSNDGFDEYIALEEK